tara:strand:- start:79 stop:267 length:189 start_codon:yes stop_codon:yes gene_type:complete
MSFLKAACGTRTHNERLGSLVYKTSPVSSLGKAALNLAVLNYTGGLINQIPTDIEKKAAAQK